MHTWKEHGANRNLPSSVTVIIITPILVDLHWLPSLPVNWFQDIATAFRMLHYQQSFYHGWDTPEINADHHDFRLLQNFPRPLPISGISCPFIYHLPQLLFSTTHLQQYVFLEAYATHLLAIPCRPPNAFQPSSYDLKIHEFLSGSCYVSVHVQMFFSEIKTTTGNVLKKTTFGMAQPSSQLCLCWT